MVGIPRHLTHRWPVGQANTGQSFKRSGIALRQDGRMGAAGLIRRVDWNRNAKQNRLPEAITPGSAGGYRLRKRFCWVCRGRLWILL